MAIDPTTEAAALTVLQSTDRTRQKDAIKAILNTQLPPGTRNFSKKAKTAEYHAVSIEQASWQPPKSHGNHAGQDYALYDLRTSSDSNHYLDGMPGYGCSPRHAELIKETIQVYREVRTSQCVVQANAESVGHLLYAAAIIEAEHKPNVRAQMEENLITSSYGYFSDFVGEDEALLRREKNAHTTPISPLPRPAPPPGLNPHPESVRIWAEEFWSNEPINGKCDYWTYNTVHAWRNDVVDRTVADLEEQTGNCWRNSAKSEKQRRAMIGCMIVEEECRWRNEDTRNNEVKVEEWNDVQWPKMTAHCRWGQVRNEDQMLEVEEMGDDLVENKFDPMRDGNDSEWNMNLLMRLRNPRRYGYAKGRQFG